MAKRHVRGKLVAQGASGRNPLKIPSKQLGTVGNRGLDFKGALEPWGFAGDD
jgi:hypothetical protein